MMSAAFSTEEEKDKNREAKGLATKKESTKQTEVKIRPHNVICFSAFLTRSILLAPKRYQEEVLSLRRRMPERWCNIQYRSLPVRFRTVEEKHSER